MDHRTYIKETLRLMLQTYPAETRTAYVALQRETPDCVGTQPGGTTDVGAQSTVVIKPEKPPYAKGFHNWISRVKQGDPIAKQVMSFIEALGRSPSTGGGSHTVACVMAISAWVEADRSASLFRLAPLIREVCHGHPCPDRIVSGFMQIETDVRINQGHSLTDDGVSALAKHLGYNRLLSLADDAVEEYKNRTGKRPHTPRICWAQGMWSALKFGVSTTTSKGK